MRTHAQIMQTLAAARATVTQAQVVNAFAASLTTRRLDWRSGLGSFAAVRHLAPHPFTPSAYFGADRCAVCGLPARSKVDDGELARKRAEQHRLIQFYDPCYAAFDLATLGTLAPSAPSADDLTALRRMLDGLGALGADARLSDLDRAIRGTFRSNKGQRRYVLEALAIAGVLCPPDLPSYATRWVTYDEREGELQVRHAYARESAYPLRHWSGAYGIDHDAIDAWFGPLWSGDG